MQSSSEILGPSGPFIKKFKSFDVRECQQEMARAVEDALHLKTQLVVESGTGTGKTLAYLTPAVLNSAKTIVSTHTKTLQNQIFEKDAPQLCKVLGSEINVRLLKGRSNYLCLHRFEKTRNNPSLHDKKKNYQVEEIARRLDQTVDGDIERLMYRIRNYELREEITATSEQCIGRKCNWWKDCYGNRARNAANKADLLVVNHALLCRDILIRLDDGDGFMPAADMIVIDEAHRFPDIVAEALGWHFFSRRVNQLCGELERAAVEADLNPHTIGLKLSEITKYLEEAHKTLFDAEEMTHPIRDSIANLKENGAFLVALNSVMGLLSDLVLNLENLKEKNTDIEIISRIAQNIVANGEKIMFDNAMASANWYAASKSGFELHSVPLSPENLFREFVESTESCWVFTSATLAVADGFTHFLDRLGLKDASTSRWGSPFHFKEQSLLYLPQDIAFPNSHEYNGEFAEQCKTILDITKGKALILFTSYKDLDTVYKMLKDTVDYPLMAQGRGQPTYQMLEEFRRETDSVLLGTVSFWEGIDVKGEALSCVIIHRLPFEHPGDPVLKARVGYMHSNGQDPFNEWQVPTAVLSLKQGVGRLLRDDSDKGLLVICDSRITKKAYGNQFLESIPDYPRTTELVDVRKFFEQ